MQGATPTVVFEDDHLLVVNKPGGMVCHSAQRPEQFSLVGWVREHGTPLPRLFNRLDRETSGLVVIAKDERAARNLDRSRQRGEIEKEYVAICWGELQQDSGSIDKPIGFDKDSPVYTKRAVDVAKGKPATTEFALEQRLRGLSVVRLHPRTGRTHQLRVHMAAVGHPIVGDKIYGPDERWYLRFINEGVTAEMLQQLLLPRQALHASSVSLRHPKTQEQCEFHAPLPPDMVAFIAAHS